MNYLHPIMQQALAGIVPPGFRSAPVMHATQFWQASNEALRATLAGFFAPPCPAGQFLHAHKHPELGELECHLEGEDASPECGWAAQVTLCTAYLRGVDIFDRLTAAEVELIEREAARQPKQIGEPA